MTAASIRANVTNPISRRVLVSRMLQVAALQAAIAGALYLTIVLPRRIEWFDAYARAQSVLVERFMRGEHSLARLHAIVDHRGECFPTEWEWFWARLRASADQVERHAMRDFASCLEEAAGEAEKVRAWKPPRPGI